jgi:NAD(P)-dependent dehydrogenase (short-subunit alcohol dehydrogenase family)
MYKSYHYLSIYLFYLGVKEMKDLNVTLAIKVDVTNNSDIIKMSTEVQSIVDSSDMRLWAIVNNAGIAPMGYMDWCPEDRYHRVMDINYFGIVSVIKSTLPLLKATRGSRIINVSSCAGLFGSTGLSAYSASKFAVEGIYLYIYLILYLYISLILIIILYQFSTKFLLKVCHSP